MSKRSKKKLRWKVKTQYLISLCLKYSLLVQRKERIERSQIAKRNLDFTIHDPKSTEHSKNISSSLRYKHLFNFLWVAKQKSLIWIVIVIKQSLDWKKCHKHFNCFVYLQLIDLIKTRKWRWRNICLVFYRSYNFNLLFHFQ